MKRLLFYLSVVVQLTLCNSCNKEYSYEGGPIPAEYTVTDSSGYCLPATVEGNFIKGKELTDSNFLTLQVHIKRTGSYSITTNQVNGYYFLSSGNFTDTGFAQVKLNAIGTPILTGENTFAINSDSSFCTLMINVTDTTSKLVITTNPYHFPLTDNSSWVYDDLTFSDDSVVYSIIGSTVKNNLLHLHLNEYKSFYPANNDRYYQKKDNGYVEYTYVSRFTSALNYSPSIYDDINFLKQDVHRGDSWYTDTYSGHTSLQLQVLKLRYQLKCLEADAITEVNGKVFEHVIIMEMRPEVAEEGKALVHTGEIHTLYYARGIGLIYSTFYNGILAHDVLKIRRWQIN